MIGPVDVDAATRYRRHFWKLTIPRFHKLLLANPQYNRLSLSTVGAEFHMPLAWGLGQPWR